MQFSIVHFFVRIKQLSQSSTQITSGSVAVISCWAIEFAAIPVLDKVLKTQELAPSPSGPWIPLNPDGPRGPWTPDSPNGPAGPWVPLYPGCPGGPDNCNDSHWNNNNDSHDDQDYGGNDNDNDNEKPDNSIVEEEKNIIELLLFLPR